MMIGTMLSRASTWVPAEHRGHGNRTTMASPRTCWPPYATGDRWPGPDGEDRHGAAAASAKRTLYAAVEPQIVTDGLIRPRGLPLGAACRSADGGQQTAGSMKQYRTDDQKPERRSDHTGARFGRRRHVSLFSG